MIMVLLLLLLLWFNNSIHVVSFVVIFATRVASVMYAL